MAETTTSSSTEEFKPFVPAETSMKEFTFKALLIGAILSILLGSANAYLGLVAGMTVAATFPLPSWQWQCFGFLKVLSWKKIRAGLRLLWVRLS